MQDEQQTKLQTLDHRVRPPKLSILSFETRELIGEGTYGKVYRSQLNSSILNAELQDGALARDWTSSYRAVKSIKFENDKDGFPITALREIQIL